MRDHRGSLSGRGTSVKDDWRARLSEEKTKAFRSYVHELESSYHMLSVSLNEALEFRHGGLLGKSYQAINVTPDLCTRLSVKLVALLRVAGDHAKHYGTVPNAVPLDATNFQSATGQRAARMSGLLSRVLLSQRTQFLHKLGTLQEMVEELDREFCASAEELGKGLSTNPALLWNSVDADHYDLNTCLRESIVLLKSFLRALPEDQLPGFHKAVLASWANPSRARSSEHRVLQHRRAAHIAGE